MVRGLSMSEEFARSLYRGVEMDRRTPLSVFRTLRQRGHLLGGQWKFGKLNASLSGGAGNKASAAIYKLNDAEDDWEDINSDLDNVYAPPLLASGETLDSGTWVIVHKHSDGKWYVTNAACSE